MNKDSFPLQGLGTYKLTGDTCTENVLFALENGINLIDTASFYNNEKEIGKALSQTNRARTDFKVTTKMWTDEMRESTARDSLLRSLDKLQLDYVDYYLVHWPVKNKWLSAYEQMLNLQQEGLIKHVGVCNFTEEKLIEVEHTFGSFPALNQVEAHPAFQQKQMHAFCITHNIQMQSWRTLMFGKVNQLKALESSAQKHNKSIYQIALKFFIQKGIAVIPKSASKKRILENFDLHAFTLSEQELELISRLDTNQRSGPHPNNFDF